MTKKDYELFANEVYHHDNGTEGGIICRFLCKVLAQDNPLFNAEKFQSACFEGKHIRKSIANA